MDVNIIRMKEEMIQTLGLDDGKSVGLDVTGGGVGVGPHVPNVVLSELPKAPPDATSSDPYTTS